MTRATPWIVALLVSILTNGIMLGFVLHETSSGPRLDGPPRHGEHRRGGGEGFNFRAFMAALPEDERRSAMDRFRESRSEMRALFSETREAQENARRAVMAEPYDASAVTDAFAELRSARMAMESAVEAVVLDIVADLDPDTRMAVIEAGRTPPRRRGPGGRRGPPHDGPPRDSPPRDGPPGGGYH